MKRNEVRPYDNARIGPRIFQSPLQEMKIRMGQISPTVTPVQSLKPKNLTPMGLPLADSLPYRTRPGKTKPRYVMALLKRASSVGSLPTRGDGMLFFLWKCTFSFPGHLTLVSRSASTYFPPCPSYSLPTYLLFP